MRSLFRLLTYINRDFRSAVIVWLLAAITSVQNCGTIVPEVESVLYRGHFSTLLVSRGVLVFVVACPTAISDRMSLSAFARNYGLDCFG